jgi:catechol 2,3-dioxygenase-like lactoylglutathione lyase family enzyme
MTVIHNITFDCADPVAIAGFWQRLLGWDLHPDSDDDEALLTEPGSSGPGLLFLRVPEPKSGKNRLHLDLRPARLRDEEVEHLLGEGATVVADHRKPDGKGWVVMADPEGNEFCVERSAAERDG